MINIEYMKPARADFGNVLNHETAVNYLIQIIQFKLMRFAMVEIRDLQYFSFSLRAICNYFLNF